MMADVVGGVGWDSKRICRRVFLGLGSGKPHRLSIPQQGAAGAGDAQWRKGFQLSFILHLSISFADTSSIRVATWQSLGRRARGLSSLGWRRYFRLLLSAVVFGHGPMT